MQISTVLPANLELLLKEKIKDTILYELRTGRALQTRAILRAKIEERLTAQINSLIPDLPENQKTRTQTSLSFISLCLPQQYLRSNAAATRRKLISTFL